MRDIQNTWAHPLWHRLAKTSAKHRCELSLHLPDTDLVRIILLFSMILFFTFAKFPQSKSPLFWLECGKAKRRVICFSYAFYRKINPDFSLQVSLHLLDVQDQNRPNSLLHCTSEFNCLLIYFSYIYKFKSVCLILSAFLP